MKHVGFFGHKEKYFRYVDVVDTDGSCIVVYHDDTVALAVVPKFDYRTLYAP